MDQAVLTFSGASTFLGLGENTIANSFTTQQFGFGYDLIIVGGNMIDVNLVSQKNAVLDSDSLSIGRQKPDPVTPEDEMEEVFVLGTSVDGISQAALKPVNLEPEEPSADELAFLDTTSVVPGKRPRSLSLQMINCLQKVTLKRSGLRELQMFGL